MKNNVPMCIYHAHCMDGYMAAMVVFDYLDGAVELVPASYGTPPPDVTDRVVYIVDFSYRYPELVAMAKEAVHILILDHHASAERELRHLPANVKTVFDMERSGAMLAWDWFHPGDPPPTAVRLVQDRDLWRFNMNNTHAFHAGLGVLRQDPDQWLPLLERAASLMPIVQRGEAILLRYNKEVEQLAKKSEMVNFHGYTVPAANAPGWYASDLGASLCIGYPFAIIYHFDNGQLKVSLRSDANGVDVARIAERFDGGGHERAAGFTVKGDIPWSS